MKKFIIANWKMNGSLMASEELVSSSLGSYGSEINTIICPPYPYMSTVSSMLNGVEGFSLGAQNCSHFNSGAYTGEISSFMLKDMGCAYVILGHSERREIYGETDEIILKKVEAVLSHGMIPIFCVGETAAQRELGRTDVVLKNQIQGIATSPVVKKSPSREKIIVAYEPVWAIGSGVSAKPNEISEVHDLIKSEFQHAWQSQCNELVIVYGGSVNPQNAEAMFEKENICGGLIGGASLDSNSFEEIRRIAANT